MDTAKVFMSGRSQALRIPKKYRLDAKEVSIRKEGDSLIITPKPAITLEEFFKYHTDPNFVLDRSEGLQNDEPRDPFADWKEEDF